MNLRKPMPFCGLCLLSACYVMGHFTSCANQWAVTSAEEYFSIGMAYFDNGKYAEAEKWLNRARSLDKTQTASEYNLGRIAFETRRYEEALRYFDRILAKDSANVMALKAAAYTHIKLGDIDAAEALYDRVLALVPESADDGYNYALVLYIMEKYGKSEEVLSRYTFALLENSDVILLLARTQRAQHKPEAMDRYAQWLETKNDSLVRYEYASVLEENGFYARALEECRTALKDLAPNSTEPKKSELHYAVARLLFIADPENEEGIAELETAVAEGFDGREGLETLLTHERISAAHKDDIRRIIDDMAEAERKREAEEDAAAKTPESAPPNEETGKGGTST
ncbi:MAG: tetratricopeptide repeat protein [Treponema sp.]|nr:tetratricopeptide repeat protein [Treponema sp.]